jgi:itaconate CoA-transferase
MFVLVNLPLSGVNVLGFEQAVAAPFATRQLRDLGARVIKVERPGVGDLARHYDTAVEGEASYFVWLNRGKESVSVDLGSTEGRDVADRLLDWADIVVSNLAPTTAERLGLTAARMRERRPKLVAVVISGYGERGEQAQRKAYDALIQAELGLMELTGPPDEPARVGISIADIAAGMYGFSAALTGLLELRRSGQGASLHVSLLSALAEWMQQPMLYASGRGESTPRTGAHHATIAPYGPFATATGSVLHVAVQTEREWQDFCRVVLRRAELAIDERLATNVLRVANRAYLHGFVDAVFGATDERDLTALLDEASIAYARWGSAADVASHPQLADMWSDAVVAGRRIPTLGFAVEGLGHAGDGVVPAVGVDTKAVLRELGLAELDVEELSKRWVETQEG